MSLVEFEKNLPETPTPESEAIEVKTHGQLLQEIFRQLTHELDANGNTQNLRRLREEASLQLMGFWQREMALYEDAVKSGKIKTNGELNLGEEKIQITTAEDYSDEDRLILSLSRRTPTENDTFRAERDSLSGRVDNFVFPPTVKSEIRPEKGEPPDTLFEITFRNGKISTLSRTSYHLDPDNLLPYVKDQRAIDFSLFGMDLY